MFNISEFLAQLDKKTISRRSHFSCLITGPQKLQSLSTERDMVFRCDAISEPGRNIQITNDAYHYGLPLARAWGSSFSEMNMSFILSNDMTEKLYFERWQDLMIGPYRNGNTSSDMFDIKYLSDYTGTVIVYKYNENGDVTYQMKLKNCFPLLVSDTDLSWDDGEYARLGVRMYFQYFIDDTSSTSGSSAAINAAP